MTATQKSPGLRGWKWAEGLKLTKADRYLRSDGYLMELNGADLAREYACTPMNWGNGWFGYIRRVRQTKQGRRK